MTSWYLLLCAAAICLLDAKPVKLEISPVASPAMDDSLLVPFKEGVTTSPEGGDEFWTRWNSDTSTSNTEPEGTTFTAADGLDFASKLHNEKIVNLTVGCGRGKNRLGTLSDGTKFCCRYRDQEWREIRGELYSYHLNSLLGMFSAPPATLVRVDFSSPRWSSVAGFAREAGWSDGKVFVATMFMTELEYETFPPILVQSDDDIVTKEYALSASPEEKSRLLQWSDLIIFDFVVGHSDRIFNTLFNLQWNSRMLLLPVHNLLKTKHGKKLLLFDNESGFWMGYKMGWKELHSNFKFEMQERYLKRMCFFRERTLRRVRYLLDGDQRTGSTAVNSLDRDLASPASLRLDRYIKEVDQKSFEMVKPLYSEERKELESRLRHVMQQVDKCEGQ